MTRRPAVTLLELLVVIAIMGVLLGLLLPAIQRARAASQRISCANNLHQIGLALHMYHDTNGVLPPGVSTPTSAERYPWMSWLTRILPYVEQQSLWAQTQIAYQQDLYPFDNPPHVGLVTPITLFTCLADGRPSNVQNTHQGLQVALTSYVGIAGTNFTTKDGVLFANSSVRLTDIMDGASSTLMVGERPPSADFWYGWWYAGVAQLGSGSPDMVLGVCELNQDTTWLVFCPPGPFHFGPGQTQDQCDVLHFWSPHAGGGNFLFADGSARFLSYSAEPMMTALATRAGGEAAALPD